MHPLHPQKLAYSKSPSNTFQHRNSAKAKRGKRYSGSQTHKQEMFKKPTNIPKGHSEHSLSNEICYMY